MSQQGADQQGADQPSAKYAGARRQALKSGALNGGWLNGRPVALRADSLRLERGVTWLLGAFIVVQCFGLPLLGVGPWALWPTLADVVFWLALLGAALYRCAVQAYLRPLWGALLLVTTLSLGSFLVLLVMQDGRLGVAVPFGAFQLFKLLQTLGVFWMVARLPLHRETLLTWQRLSLFSFVVMVLSVTWTYFAAAIPGFFGEFLPRGRGVAGPWEAYYRHEELGLGTLGFNHAYVAALVLLQGAFLMMLRPGRNHTWVLLGIVVACFLSGARAGLVGAVLFVLLEGLRTPLRSTLTVLAVGVAGLFAMPYLHADLNSLIARQATILDAGDTGNLAGRGEIWQSYLNSLSSDPFRLLLGSGMGSAIGNHGVNAHMLVLQVLYETGLVGVTVMGLLFWLLFRQLSRVHSSRASIAIHLLLGLWASSFAAETLYPNPAFGSFLPMLALVLVVALTPLDSVPLQTYQPTDFTPVEWED